MANIKRMASLVLAGAMIASIAGCASSSSSSAASSGSTASNSGAAASSGTEERGHITVSVYDRGNVPVNEGTIENNRWTEWINENGPVDVTFVAIPRVNPEEKLNVLYASGDAPDLVFEYSPAVKTPLYQQGMFMPISDMIEQYSTVYKARAEEFPSVLQVGSYDDGQVYQFCRINNSIVGRGLLIRTDWLENLNLEIPTTLDELKTVLKAFVDDDPDGNGVDDTYGIAISYQAGPTVDEMFAADEIIMTENGMEYGWDRLATQLEFKKFLYENNIIDKEYLTDTNGARATQAFVTGKLGIYPGLNNLTRTTFINDFKNLRENVPEAKIAYMLPVDVGYGNFIPTYGNPVQAVAVVSSTAKDPASVMKYVDFLCTTEYSHTFQYGIEGVHYTLDDDGIAILDDEKRKAELTWASDFSLLRNESTFTLSSPYQNFKMDDPFEAECYEIYKAGHQMHFEVIDEWDYHALSHSEHIPVLPKELTVVESNIVLDDIYDRCIVGGPDYTVEQAIEDAKAAWEKGGGEQIMEWWQNWYANDRDSAFLWEDMKAVIKANDFPNQLP